VTAPALVGPSSSSGGPVPSPDWDDILADIGDRIRAERQARGLAQQDLADRARLDRVTVRRLEDGIGSIRVFVQACWVLEVDPGQLMAEQWAMPAPKASPRYSLSPRQAQVLQAVAGGDSLSRVGVHLGLDRSTVASFLSQAYRRLGVADLPVRERRAVAIRVAMKHGLFTSSNRTS